MEPDERQDSNSKLADELTLEPTTELTPETSTDVVKAAKMKKNKKILNVLNKKRN